MQQNSVSWKELSAGGQLKNQSGRRESE